MNRSHALPADPSSATVAAPRPTHPADRAAVGRTTPEPEEKAKGPDLTVNKVIAGAGAAATSAVFGSYFGASGTVVGAAVGSVVTTLGSTIYQRSLDRTRDTVKAKIKLPSGRTVEVTRDATTGLDSAAQLTMPMPRVSPEGRPIGPWPPGAPRPGAGGPPRQMSPALAAGRNWRPRRLAVMGGITVLIFALGLLAVTGVEWAKGSPLSGGVSGTSVSRVLHNSGDTGTGSNTKGTEPTGSTGATESPTSAEPSATATPTPTATATPEPSSANSTGSTPAPRSAVPTQNNGFSGGAGNRTPTTAPTSGALLPGIGG